MVWFGLPDLVYFTLIGLFIFCYKIYLTPCTRVILGDSREDVYGTSTLNSTSSSGSSSSGLETRRRQDRCNLPSWDCSSNVIFIPFCSVFIQFCLFFTFTLCCVLFLARYSSRERNVMHVYQLLTRSIFSYFVFSFGCKQETLLMSLKVRVPEPNLNFFQTPTKSISGSHIL